MGCSHIHTGMPTYYLKILMAFLSDIKLDYKVTNVDYESF